MKQRKKTPKWRKGQKLWGVTCFGNLVAQFANQIDALEYANWRNNRFFKAQSE